MFPVTVWCREATRHCVSHCWPISLSSYFVTNGWWVYHSHIITLVPEQNGRHFTDDIFKCIFLNENVWISIKISLKFVPKDPIDHIQALVQIMAELHPGDKPLSEPMVASLPTHICVTRPQWVIADPQQEHGLVTNSTFTIRNNYYRIPRNVLIVSTWPWWRQNTSHAGRWMDRYWKIKILKNKSENCDSIFFGMASSCKAWRVIEKKEEMTHRCWPQFAMTHEMCSTSSTCPKFEMLGLSGFSDIPGGGVKVAMALQRDCEIVHVIIAVIEGLPDGHANMNHKRGINS